MTYLKATFLYSLSSIKEYNRSRTAVLNVSVLPHLCNSLFVRNACKISIFKEKNTEI